MTKQKSIEETKNLWRIRKIINYEIFSDKNKKRLIKITYGINQWIGTYLLEVEIFHKLTKRSNIFTNSIKKSSYLYLKILQ